MADISRSAPNRHPLPVVDQIDSLLRRDPDVVVLGGDRIVVDLADAANAGLAIIEPEPEEEPDPGIEPLDVDLSDPAVIDSLERLAAQLDDPQLRLLVGLVRRQAGSPG